MDGGDFWKRRSGSGHHGARHERGLDDCKRITVARTVEPGLTLHHPVILARMVQMLLAATAATMMMGGIVGNEWRLSESYANVGESRKSTNNDNQQATSGTGQPCDKSLSDYLSKDGMGESSVHKYVPDCPAELLAFLCADSIHLSAPRMQ